MSKFFWLGTGALALYVILVATGHLGTPQWAKQWQEK